MQRGKLDNTIGQPKDGFDAHHTIPLDASLRSQFIQQAEKEGFSIHETGILLDPANQTDDDIAAEVIDYHRLELLIQGVDLYHLKYRKRYKKRA